MEKNYKNPSKRKKILRKLWKWSKRIFIWLFIFQLCYIIALKWINPPITITQLASWVSGHGLHRDFVKKKNISPKVRLAVMASEDQLYPDHNGFDWQSIQKAMQFNEKHKNRIRGGSTISQQTAKNIFLWQGRSWIRKGLEMYFTFMIEKIWGKKRILELYLNEIEMGKGIFGIEAAAQKYFHKPAAQLSKTEAATIAALLPNPKIYGANIQSAFIKRRTQQIVRQMQNIETDEDIKNLVD